jgi:hypothetical protein
MGRTAARQCLRIRLHGRRAQAALQTEIQLERAAYAATLLALVIVLLGVLGLVSVSVQRRVKEIGIRKVLGRLAARHR